MTNRIYTPFTYLIGWSWLNIWYYGGRWKQGCHPDDLWTKYFTSSVYVAVQRWLYGEPDVIEVRRIFKTKEETQDWEIKVLKRMKVVKNERWLNKTDLSVPFRLGHLHSDESKLKISRALSGRIGPRHSDESKRKIGVFSQNRTYSNETLKKMSDALKGRTFSDETLKKMSDSHKGKCMSDITKRKISETLKSKNKKV